MPSLEYTIRKHLEKEATQFATDPANVEYVQRFRRLLELVVTSLPFPVVLWEVQNICYSPLIKATEQLRREAQKDDPTVQHTLNELGLLREKLRISGN